MFLLLYSGDERILIFHSKTKRDEDEEEMKEQTIKNLQTELTIAKE